MNNGMNNTRGPEIRKAVVFLLLVGFCVALFAPSAAASQWAPTKVFPHIDNIVIRPEMDETGWNDQNSKNGWDGKSLLGCFDFRITAPTLFLYFFDFFDKMDTPDSPDQGNGNDRESLDHDRTTPTQ